MSMIGEEIRMLRKSKGLTMQKFAVLIGVDRNTVFRWEHGIRKPSPLAQEKLEKIKMEVR